MYHKKEMIAFVMENKVEIKDLFPLRDFQKVTYRKCAGIDESLYVSYQAKQNP